jgi:hypothetical protein
MRTFTIPTLFVLGNHETVPGNREKLEKFREKSENSVVTVFENNIIEKDGVRFPGCTLWAPANQRMRTSMNNSIVMASQNAIQRIHWKNGSYYALPTITPITLTRGAHG